MSIANIKVFTMMEIREARQWAKDGNRSLHLHNIIIPGAPNCFIKAVEKRREYIAHLVDLDKPRLISFCRSLGVNVIYIDKEDSDFQHIDLCGYPLRKLLQKLGKEDMLHIVDEL